MFSTEFQVMTSDCDENGRLKLFSALQMMQDCSELWTFSEPVFRNYLDSHGMAQLLASRQVEVLRVPSYRERLTVTTSIFDCKPLFGFRNTVIRDAAGRMCYRGWSMGAFVSLATGKLSPLGQEVLDSYVRDGRIEMDYRDRRVVVPKEADTVVHDAVRVQRNDIDYNRHMNNANYVRIALELVPVGFDIKGVRIEFKMPARLGDMLVPETVCADGAFYTVLKLGGKVSTVVEFTGESR